MDVKKDNSEWWVIGYTNYPLKKVYKKWKSNKKKSNDY